MKVNRFALVPRIILLLFASQLAGCDYQLKLLELNQALDKNPKNTEALYNRGTLRYEMGDVQGAIVDLTKFSELEPHDPSGHAKLSIVYRHRGQKEKAIHHLRLAANIALRKGDRNEYKSIMKDIEIFEKRR
jgi:Flp pilus assembly protein TadD